MELASFVSLFVWFFFFNLITNKIIWLLFFTLKADTSTVIEEGGGKTRHVSERQQGSSESYSIAELRVCRRHARRAYL